MSNNVIDFKSLPDFQLLEDITDILAIRTQNKDKAFFRINAAYALSKIAAHMHVTVNATAAFGQKININFYGLNLAPSGYGKGHSTAILNKEIIKPFMDHFNEYTRPQIEEENLTKLANKRAVRSGEDPDEVREKVMKEFNDKGKFVPSFDSGTPEGAKQYVQRLLMSKIGAVNFEVDEIGSNLLKNEDLTALFLELYDGEVRSKLIKNTKDNVRSEKIEGTTPCNMLMFGEPTALFDGHKNEEQLNKLLQTGYARRCFYGYSEATHVERESDVDARLKAMLNHAHDPRVRTIAAKLKGLADASNYGTSVKLSEDALRRVVAYQIHCEQAEKQYRSNETVRKAEVKDRHYKAIKLAALFAWLESSNIVEAHHYDCAIKIAEDSGRSFEKMLNRPPIHARLAEYLASDGAKHTIPELMENLTYFPKSAPLQRELLKATVAYGHRNNIVVLRSVVDDIEFIQGEALQVTDPEKLIIAMSQSMAEGYAPHSDFLDGFPFRLLPKIMKVQDKWHWTAHQFQDNYRNATNALPGFNMIVLDIDGTATVKEAKTVLSDYQYLIYTSKSHRTVCDKNPTGNKEYFRIVLPMSHVLKLEADTYKEFMNNIHEFLPFEADSQTGEIARKWETNPTALIEMQADGKLFDVLPFIPKTKKNQDRQIVFKEIRGEGHGIIRWFLTKVKQEGHRNNNLMKFGLLLLDSGLDIIQTQDKIRELNAKFDEPLSDNELTATIFTSLANRLQRK